MSNECTKDFTLSIVPLAVWSVAECYGHVYDLGFSGTAAGATWNPDSEINVAAPCPFPPFDVESQWLFCVNAAITFGPFATDKVITVTGNVALGCPAGRFPCGFPFFPFSIGFSYCDIQMTGLVGYTGNVSLHAEDPVTNPGAIVPGTYPISVSGTLTAGNTTLLTVGLNAGSPLDVTPAKPTSVGTISISIV